MGKDAKNLFPTKIKIKLDLNRKKWNSTKGSDLPQFRLPIIGSYAPRTKSANCVSILLGSLGIWQSPLIVGFPFNPAARGKPAEEELAGFIIAQNEG
jgi:hypothetical protein